MQTTMETWWTSFLSLWRAILLGGRIKDPQQLAYMLLFMPPVEGLTPADIGRLLNWSDKANWGPYFDPPEFDHRIPKHWTVVTELSTYEDSGASLWDFEVCVAALIQGFDQRGFVKGTDYDIVEACSNTPWLIYRVLDDRGFVTAIATWMESRRQLMRDHQFGETIPEDVRKANTCAFLENAVETVLHIYIEDRFDAEELDAMAADLRRVRDKVKVGHIASWIYDQGKWSDDYYMGPDTGMDMVHEACQALGYFQRKKKILAADLAA